MFPSFFIEVFNFEGLTATVSKLLSLILNLTSSPAAKAVATLVVILPLFDISGEISATYSPLIFPLVVILEAELVEKLKLLFKKLLFVILSVDNIAPSALIAEVGPVKIPNPNLLLHEEEESRANPGRIPAPSFENPLCRAFRSNNPGFTDSPGVSISSISSG